MMFKRLRQVYLDVNATTPIAPEVRRRMVEVIDKHPGNASSAYRLGREAAALIARARAEVAATINASPSEVVFTSGASEGNNHVLRMVTARASASRRRLVTAAVEHPSVRSVAEDLARAGVTVTWLPVDRYGRIRSENLAAALDDTVCLVSCMVVNNELGTVNPVRDLAALAHAQGIPFHADCAQALGKMPVDVGALGVDYATFSAHKVFGPKGVGVLYVRDGVSLHPFITGGHQEQERRAGTESTHDIAGCGAAFARVPELLAKVPIVIARRDALLARLRAVKPDLIENSPPEGVVPNTLNLRFPGVRNADLLAFLDLHGVSVSAGSACSAEGGKPSHVLTAIGLTEAEAQESLRLSLSAEISDDDITYVADLVDRFVRGEAPAISLISPRQIDAAFLDDERNYLLDVRLGVERRLMKGMPNSREIPFFDFSRWLDHVPRERNIVVVCSTGVDATIVAYALKSRGFPHVGLLVGGLLAWRAAHAALYRARAGSNVSVVSRGAPVA